MFFYGDHIRPLHFLRLNSLRYYRVQCHRSSSPSCLSHLHPHHFHLIVPLFRVQGNVSCLPSLCSFRFFEEPGLFFVTYNTNLNVAFNFLPGRIPVSHLAPFVCICLWKVPLFVSPFNFLPLSQPFSFYWFLFLLHRVYDYSCLTEDITQLLLPCHLPRGTVAFWDVIWILKTTLSLCLIFFQNWEKALLFSFLPPYILNVLIFLKNTYNIKLIIVTIFLNYFKFCVYTPLHVSVGAEGGQGGWIPWSWSCRGCERRDMGVGNQTGALCKSGTRS